MKKKIFFTGLAIFCLGLLLGAFSSCYAFTEDDVRSLIYNTYVPNWQANASATKTACDNINFTNWNNYFNNDNYQLLYSSNASTMKIFVRYKTGHPYNVSGTIYGTTFVGEYVSYKNGSITSSVTKLNNLSSREWYQSGSAYFTEFDIYTGSNTNNIYVSAGTSNRSWLFNDNDYNVQEVFGFQEVDTNTHVKLASDGISMPLYYSPGSSVYFVDFIDDDGTGQTIFGKVITGDELYMYYYTVSSWNGSVNLFRRNFNSLNDFTSNRYININRPISGYTINKISLKSPYIITNVVYHYIINYLEDGIPKFVDYYFYVGDSNTSTIDGVIDVPTSIPDLDVYHNRFNNITNLVNDNENTDNIIDSIESGDNKIQDIITDDSEVDSIIGNFLSGDNADELVSSLGLNSISSIQNPFTSIIYNVFMGIIDCFGSTENISLNFGFGGQNNIVYASQFITPANNTIIVLVKYCLIFGYVYGIVWFYYRSIENLKHLGDKGISILTNSVREDAAFDWRLL